MAAPGAPVPVGHLRRRPTGGPCCSAGWRDGAGSDDATDLLEDAANSLRLALERERALLAQQEAMALRQSRELQRTFLRRLSHELRTPLTAITGYATSLLQQDVTWDADSQQRFLSRIAAESARLGRLVNDLLGLLHDRVGHPAAQQRLVRHPAGPRRGGRRAAAGRRVRR